MTQPPSGIGPGAVGAYGQYGGLNNSYTMAWGEDRDPYGAQMPYRIPYETYNPNYPAIPGVANSFAPPEYSQYDSLPSNNDYGYASMVNPAAVQRAYEMALPVTPSRSTTDSWGQPLEVGDSAKRIQHRQAEKTRQVEEVKTAIENMPTQAPVGTRRASSVHLKSESKPQVPELYGNLEDAYGPLKPISTTQGGNFAKSTFRQHVPQNGGNGYGNYDGFYNA